MLIIWIEMWQVVFGLLGLRKPVRSIAFQVLRSTLTSTEVLKEVTMMQATNITSIEPPKLAHT